MSCEEDYRRVRVVDCGWRLAVGGGGCCCGWLELWLKKMMMLSNRLGGVECECVHAAVDWIKSWQLRGNMQMVYWHRHGTHPFLFCLTDFWLHMNYFRINSGWTMLDIEVIWDVIRLSSGCRMWSRSFMDFISRSNFRHPHRSHHRLHILCIISKVYFFPQNFPL